MRVLAHGGTTHGLHVDNTGLYLLTLPTGGKVIEICALGYLRTEHEHKLRDESGDIDLVNVMLGLFVYVILYRPVANFAAGTHTLYTMVYDPIVVSHEIFPGCISRDDVFNWEVDKGDLLGLFIPDNCTTLDDLSPRDDMDAFTEMDLMENEFCPAQINLVNDPGQCFHALYLNTSESATLDQIESFDIWQVNDVSTKLNINVTIEGGKYVQIFYFIRGSGAASWFGWSSLKRWHAIAIVGLV